MKTQGREGVTFQDNRPDDIFYAEETPGFKPTKTQLASVAGSSQSSMDDATSIINDMLTSQRMQERSWVKNKDVEDLVNQKGIYAPWKQDLIDKQNHNSNQFLLDTFKRARSVGYPIHALVPYLQDQLPMTTFVKSRWETNEQGFEDNPEDTATYLDSIGR